MAAALHQWADVEKQDELKHISVRLSTVVRPLTDITLFLPPSLPHLLATSPQPLPLTLINKVPSLSSASQQWTWSRHTQTHTPTLSLTELRPHVCSEVLSSQRACVISQLQLWLQWLWDILTWKVRLHILSSPTSHKPQATASAAQLAVTSNTNKLE